MSGISFDVMPLIAGALYWERQHWRDNAVCHAGDLIRAIEGDRRMHRRPAAPRSALLRELQETVSNLATAITGDYFGNCVACAQQVYPGDICIPSDEPWHADCTGRHGIKAGDHIPMEAEAVDLQEGETYPGYLIAFAEPVLFTEEQVLAKVAVAVAFLEANGGV
jgi:hypothetical protein